MRTVGAYEAKTHLAELLDEVERGGVVTIARHGKPVAVLVPATAPRVDAAALIEAIRGFAACHSLGGLSLSEMVSEGRR
ncbi:MAG: type II toxin-antitoxin system prevent-host-death family antitoxin [Thermoanaerobaculaceae bacterium]|jgi:prevent-host-death family protein|nr:type II toxin-antitoxin system prevent-host-death family antitoxin [Thermoanaerobaculaceae bacterium]